MPTCCRCGKNLSTQQALQYHYNKKFKCNFAWKCQICEDEPEYNNDTEICPKCNLYTKQMWDKLKKTEEKISSLESDPNLKKKSNLKKK